MPEMDESFVVELFEFTCQLVIPNSPSTETPPSKLIVPPVPFRLIEPCLYSPESIFVWTLVGPTNVIVPLEMASEAPKPTTLKVE